MLDLTNVLVGKDMSNKMYELFTMSNVDTAVNCSINDMFDYSSKFGIEGYQEFVYSLVKALHMRGVLNNADVIIDDYISDCRADFRELCKRLCMYSIKELEYAKEDYSKTAVELLSKCFKELSDAEAVDNFQFDVSGLTCNESFGDLITLFTTYEDINNVENVKRIIRCYLTMLYHESSSNWFDDIIRDLMYNIDKDRDSSRINVDFKQYHKARDKVVSTEELLRVTMPMARWMLDIKAPYKESLQCCIDIFSAQHVDVETMFVNVYTLFRYVYHVNSVPSRIQELKKHFMGLAYGGVANISEEVIHVSTQLIDYIYASRDYFGYVFDVAEVLSLLSKFIENCIRGCRRS